MEVVSLLKQLIKKDRECQEPLCQPRNRKLFNQQESQLIVELAQEFVENNKQIDWDVVAAKIQWPSPLQCKSNYYNTITRKECSQDVKKLHYQQWTTAETQQLLQLAVEYQKNWAQIAAILKRSKRQVMDKYNSVKRKAK